MDHDDQTIGRIFTRRQAMKASAVAGLSLAIGSWFPRGARAATPATQPRLPLVASPVLTEGPFFVDEKLNRSDLIAGSKRSTVAGGLPLALTFTLYKVSGDTVAPMTDAHVDVWHADAAGVYSDESNPMNHEDTSKQTWLRGYQATDAAGNASFATIFPGWYQGRAPHIHFKVRQFSAAGNSTAEFTSQVFFREADAKRIYSQGVYAAHGRHDTHNRNDGVYSERLSDGSIAGDAMLLDLQRTGTGYTAVFPIVLTDANLRAGGSHNNRGGPPRRRDGNTNDGPGNGFGSPPGGDLSPPAW